MPRSRHKLRRRRQWRHRCKDEPELATKETARQLDKKNIRANVQRETRQFHVRAGHLSLTGMVRVLRRAGAEPGLLKYIDLFKHQEEHARPKPTRYADD